MRAVPFYFVHINVFRQLYIYSGHKYKYNNIKKYILYETWLRSVDNVAFL